MRRLVVCRDSRHRLRVRGHTKSSYGEMDAVTGRRTMRVTDPEQIPRQAPLQLARPELSSVNMEDFYPRYLIRGTTLKVLSDEADRVLNGQRSSPPHSGPEKTRKQYDMRLVMVAVTAGEYNGKTGWVNRFLIMPESD